MPSRQGGPEMTLVSFDDGYRAIDRQPCERTNEVNHCDCHKNRGPAVMLSQVTDDRWRADQDELSHGVIEGEDRSRGASANVGDDSPARYQAPIPEEFDRK